MSCTGLDMLNPACQVASAAQNAADSAFGNIATTFAQAATTATNWLWSQIDTATTVDLSSPALHKELAVTAAIALVICLGLFVLQLITAALRRDPSGLSRAVQGLFIMALGSGFALATTQVLLAAVDALADAVVKQTLGTSMRGIGAQLTLASLATMNNSAIMLLLALAILASTVIVWVAMMVRKMLLIICAVLAPLAFAGATADITRSWVRKWVEFVAAMIAAKLLLVLILATGVAVTQGAGMSSREPGQVGTQIAIGALILLLGGLSPWLAIRMCVFVGDSLYAAHLQAGQATTGARLAMAAPQKVAYMRAGLASSMGGRASGVVTSAQTGGSGGAGGSSGSGGSSTGPTLRPPGKGDGTGALGAIPGPGSVGTGGAPTNSSNREPVSAASGAEPRAVGHRSPEPARATPPLPQPPPTEAPRQPDFSKIRRNDQ